MSAPKPSFEPFFVPLEQVVSREPRWLWPNLIPAGKLTVLDGDPSAGKSILAVDLAARVSKDGLMPDGSTGLEGEVILVTNEPIADAVLPRLKTAGANIQRIKVLPVVRDGERKLPLLLPRDLPVLRTLLDGGRVKLLVIDPFLSFLGGDVTQTLRQLGDLADETGCAILLVRHLARGKVKEPLYRGAGPMAIIAAARSALLLARHPDDPECRVLVPYKNSLGKLAQGRTFTIEEPSRAREQAVEQPLTDVRGPDAPGVHGANVVWGEVCPLTAPQLLAPREAADPGELKEATHLLEEMLASGPVEVVQARQEASKLGITDWALRKAKEVLGLRSMRQGFGPFGIWHWLRPQEEGDRGQESGVSSRESAVRSLLRGVARLAPMQKPGKNE
jgi:hypothetical protein